MLGNSEQSVRWVHMGKSGPLEHAELANQIQGFRIQIFSQTLTLREAFETDAQLNEEVK